MTDEHTVKATLSRLAAGAGATDEAPTAEHTAEYRQTIERATASLDDIEAAAAFVEDTGIDRLARAVEAAEQSVSACAEQGRATLTEYRRFRAAAAGEQFHSGRGTSLGDGDKAESR